MEEYLNLPQGHLLNLQPRPRNGRRTRAALNERKRSSSPSREPENAIVDEQDPTGDTASKEPDTALAPPPLRRAKKATKLPKSKSLTGNGKESGNLAESEEQKKKDHSPAPLKGPSPGTSRPRASPPTDKDREQYWGKVREMFDKDSKDRPKGHYQEAYRKILSLANSSKQELTKQRLKYAGGHGHPQPSSPPRGGVSKTKIPSPKSTQPKSGALTRNPLASHPPSQGKSRPIRERSLSLDTREHAAPKASDKTDTTTESSIQSFPSISPVSGPSSSITEWEDRFVVNMPSAKEPNPATMDEDQIAEFQKSIERVHSEGGAMLDPDTLPSPRTRSPEENSDRCEKDLKSYDGQDSRSGPSEEAPNVMSEETPDHRRYYSPDEVGKQRFSTIWEESPGRPKRQGSDINPDGSFLGCKEIKGPKDKNPDEVLLFSTYASPTEERPRLIDVSRAPKEWKKGTTGQVKSAAEQKGSTLQDEWRPISQNLKNALCSRPSPKTLCQESKCQKPEQTGAPPKSQGKENTNCTAAGLTRGRHVQKKKRPDDVFIITPTITRTWVNMDDTNGTMRKRSGIPESMSAAAKPGGSRNDIATDTRAKPAVGSMTSGLRRATQNSWERSYTSYIPLRPGDAPTVAAKAEPDGTGVERSRPIRGFLHMPGMVKSSTENFDRRVHSSTTQQKSLAFPPMSINSETLPVRSVSDSPRSVSPVKHSDQPEYSRSMRSARIVEVAELDGLQLGDPREGLKANNTVDTRFESRQSPASNVPLDAVSSIRRKSIATPREPQQVLNPLTWSLVMDILALSAAQAHGIYNQLVGNRKTRMDLAKTSLDCILGMLGHCLYVFREILTAFSTYNATGRWPGSEDKDILRSLTDFGQAVFYLAALGFLMMVIGRAAGYVVLVGSWIVWFTRPFGWILGSVARAVLT
ncbi:hypothetical protein BDV59DRAFT_190694 [Aspergillus ambiguus]|uniref:putative NTP binding protein n=1 Tax=Aspergillus ambiguus TaxID=176160 RepID=UPI003CCDB1A8